MGAGAGGRGGPGISRSCRPSLGFLGKLWPGRGLGWLGQRGECRGWLPGPLRREPRGEPGAPEWESPLKSPSLEATKEKSVGEPLHVSRPWRVRGATRKRQRIIFQYYQVTPRITEWLSRDYTAGLGGGQVLLSRFLQSACSMTSTMYFACSPIFIVEGDFCPSHSSS